MKEIFLMTIRLFENDDKKRWDEFVKRVDGTAHYHYSGWKTVIEKSFGHKTYYLLSEDEWNNIDGILPMVHLKSRLFGSFLVSLPYFNYGGICAERAEVGPRLLQEAIHIGERENVEHIELREVRELNGPLSIKRSKVVMNLRLPSRAEDLWGSFSSKLRSQIRRPQKEGLIARIGREDELDGFYEVFSTNMRDLGTPVYSKSFFKNILEEFEASTWICSVYKEKQPVASGFLVSHKDRVEIPWASSLRDYNFCSPNMLLYWSALNFACDRGYRLFDFGRSTPGEGTYRFKEQWGAKPVPLYWHYWLRKGGALPELNPANPKYRIAINLWKRLPVGLTRLIGPSIVKNLP